MMNSNNPRINNMAGDAASDPRKLLPRDLLNMANMPPQMNPKSSSILGNQMMPKGRRESDENFVEPEGSSIAAINLQHNRPSV